jgi:phosphoglycolate phosphatase-like HAD superfamily hydrolase
MVEFPEAKTIFVDWSGVVSNDTRAVHASNNLMLKKYGKPELPMEEWLPRSRGNVVQFFESQGVKLKPEEFFRDHEELFPLAAEGNAPHLYPRADEFLEKACRNHFVIVISSHPHSLLLREAKGYGVASHAHLIRGSVRDKAKEMEFFFETHGFSREESVYIGDTVSDVRDAKRAGVRMIAVTGGYHTEEMLRPEEPDLLVGSLADLCDGL